MNEYNITYTTIDEELYNAAIIERSEAAARKSFKAGHSGAKITSVALVRDGVSATKQQERDTLAEIRKMVEELGPQSYIGTALEGCFEIAEQNIDNDFGCSMQQRAEAAEEKVADLQREIAEARKKFESSLALAHAISDQKDDEIATLKIQIQTIQKPVEPSEISDDLLADLAIFSQPYVERIRTAIIANAGYIAKDTTIVRLLHEYAVRAEQERIDYAREVVNAVKRGDEFRPSNNCLTHASSYRQIIEDLLRHYWE